MNRHPIIVPALLICGVMVGAIALVCMANDDMGPLGWTLTILGGLALAFIAAFLLNFAIMAPVFWLLGKLSHRNDSPTPPDQHE